MKLYDEIARTAHDLYMKSGCVPGRDVENWVEAERIVKARHEENQNPGEKNDSQAAEPAKKRTVSARVKETPATKKTESPKKTTVKRTSKAKKKE